MVGYCFLLIAFLASGLFERSCLADTPFQSLLLLLLLFYSGLSAFGLYIEGLTQHHYLLLLSYGWTSLP